jgi:hypothetical protein
MAGANRKSTSNRAAALSNSQIMQRALAAGLVNTPGGFRRPEFVHLVRPDQIVVNRAGISHLLNRETFALTEAPAKEVAQKSPADQSRGWAAWAVWNNQTGQPIDSFRTTWIVPPPPATQSGQLVYLFNGLQNPGGTEILQPVLQWGVSGAGGGNFWSVASWHVDSQNQAYCTPAVRVNTGDVLSGIMTQTAVFSDGTHNYNCQFQGLPDTSLMALGLTELTAAEQTLEAYGITGTGDYPAAPCVKMSQIAIDAGGNQPSVTWQEATMQNPLYGEHAAVVSNSNPGGEVDLFY